MSKVIVLPQHDISLVDPNGKLVQKKNTFLHLLGQVVEATPQKNSTDTYLAFAIQQRLDQQNGAITIDLEEAEIRFIQQGVEFLRQKEAVQGAHWYHFIKPLEEAVDRKEYERKNKPDVTATE